MPHRVIRDQNNKIVNSAQIFNKDGNYKARGKYLFKELGYANSEDLKYFCRLSFEHNIDYDLAHKKFKNFLSNIQKKLPNLKYLAKMELGQAKKRPHLHILSNISLGEYWKYLSHCEIIKSIIKVINYLVYKEWPNKWFKSKNLNRPNIAKINNLPKNFKEKSVIRKHRYNKHLRYLTHHDDTPE